MMLMVTPCTDWYLVFTALAKGNVAFSTALLPINLILQLLLPIYLLILTGVVIPIEFRDIVASVVWVLMLPFALALIARRLAIRYRNTEWLENTLLSALQPWPIVLLGLAITAMFASKGHVIVHNMHIWLVLLTPIILFFAINLLLSLIVGKLLKTEFANVVSLCCTILARNSPVALAIALVVFPDQPLVPLALVIGPLIELPILGMVTQLLLWIGRHNLFAGQISKK